MDEEGEEDLEDDGEEARSCPSSGSSCSQVLSLRRQWLLDLEQENSLRMQEVKPSPESSKSKSPSAVGSPPKKGAEDREKISNCSLQWI